MIDLASDFIIFAFLVLVPPDGGISASLRHPDYFGVNHSALNHSALISLAFNHSALNHSALNCSWLFLVEYWIFLSSPVNRQLPAPLDGKAYLMGSTF